MATETVVPLGPPEPIGELLTLHQQADRQLRFVNDIWAYWDTVTTGTMGFSGIRMRNATPRRPLSAAPRPLYSRSASPGFEGELHERRHRAHP
ncbi:DUF6886 family protein [Streptomyces sp. NPDC102467]|uniref:DUF6886 family protein n=1 Tax=Streptomyces sp. NPDC102467 TaxID=3366179 RepID=UPI003824C0E4